MSNNRWQIIGGFFVSLIIGGFLDEFLQGMIRNDLERLNFYQLMTIIILFLWIIGTLIYILVKLND